MGKAKFAQACVCAVALAGAPFGGAGGLAQPVTSAPASASDVTTVAPVTVTSPLMAAIPIPPLTTKQLNDAASEAHIGSIGALWSACDNTESEAAGNFDMNALLKTDAHAQAAVEYAALEAQTATQAADAAKASGSAQAIATSEAARQVAVRAYEGAKAVAAEAHQRVADLQDIPELRRLAALRNMDWHRPPTPEQIRAVIDESTRQRLAGGGPGASAPPGVYVPEEYKDLGLSDIVATQVTVKGAVGMHITGKIHNTRKMAIPVPPLWFTAVSSYGEPLKSEQAQRPAFTRQIPAGGSIVFTYDLKPMPVEAVRAVVTFAPQERPRRDAWIKFNDLPGCHSPTHELADLEAGKTPPPDAPWISGLRQAGLVAPPPITSDQMGKGAPTGRWTSPH